MITRHVRTCHLCRCLALFGIGGLLYCGAELLWRGWTHWTMGVLGGLCFVLIGLINEVFPWDTSLVAQMVIAAALVTMAELFAGLFINVWLGLGVWDYSGLPYNLWGQVCLLYTNLWTLLALPAIVADDWLRHWLFGQERPRYRIL